MLCILYSIWLGILNYFFYLLSHRDNNLKPESVKKAFKRFQATDKDKSGTIDYVEFCENFQVDPSPLAENVFQLYDYEKGGQVSHVFDYHNNNVYMYVNRIFRLTPGSFLLQYLILLVLAKKTN